MLFTDPVFLYLYLPVVLAVYYLAARLALHRTAMLWLLAASLAFYAYDDARRLVPLITGSIGFNYLVGMRLRATRTRSTLAAGVAGNLLLLGYFKYAQFFADSVAALAGGRAPALDIVLPIGISFYTFTQIAYLVDLYRGHDVRYRLSDYALFVTFFPHLVAGPILRHHDTVPQLERTAFHGIDPAMAASGIGWFAIGLGKKVLCADTLAPYADAAFDVAQRGEPLAAAAAWTGTAAYSLQLYFDFSGYSDMAIGLALMTGIVFPVNFDSPYKAASLIDFWRRWHITLSTFLRDYLYIPLGGNRRGTARRYANLLITMILGGLWHGASWNFVLWGAMHGGGLALNTVWRQTGADRVLGVPRPLGRAVTLLFVILAWVPFRAESMAATGHMWTALVAGAGSASLPSSVNPWPIALVAILGLIALTAPNTQQILGPPGVDRESPHGGTRLTWRWAVAAGMVFGLAASRSLAEPTSFLYFRF